MLYASSCVVGIQRQAQTQPDLGQSHLGSPWRMASLVLLCWYYEAAIREMGAAVCVWSSEREVRSGWLRREDRRRTAKRETGRSGTD